MDLPRINPPDGFCSRWILFALFLAICTPQSAHAAREVGIAAVRERITHEIQARLDDYGIPSISIALLKDDRIVWHDAFGYANVRQRVPATPHTIYNTGSCFKPITSMAVLQLVDDGKLELDSPINKYLGEDSIDDLSEDGTPITIRHLLSHYSGITTPYQMIPLWQRRAPRSLAELGRDVRVRFAPGTRFQYSNVNYALCGLLVEKVSGISFEDYLVQNLLRPVGVQTDGPVHPTPAMIEMLAVPYRLENFQAIPAQAHWFDVYPAGDIYLTVPDMAKLLLPHINRGKHGDRHVLSREMVAEMRTPQFGGTNGLDFYLRESNGERLISHGGGVPGYSSWFMLGVDSTIGVYVAANAGNVDMPLRTIGQLAIDLLRGVEVGTGLVRQISGIGAGFEVDDSTGILRVTDVFPRSPAAKAGLDAGTIIERINGIAVKGKSIEQCLELMSGPAGTKVSIAFTATGQVDSQHAELTKQAFLVPS